ncbi:hypothetical protein ORV05_20515 [Amycolatopsis cynarae]|uniref:Short-chain dehydrogenase n=1 Tax=Amycolatopsis cynarae TaxID=2995223 RepID=A0ABY7AXQ1_9PSEU|nr:hypothetical protein [Amycolatopsis sp. HUAS 11-8]WAL63398.1 hypothetical protein ORV05_20515 [Amycolatopsis sp. HUAS 11-8]
MTGRKALILAGTGMLASVAQALVRDGWTVVLPCRRYHPIAVPEPRQGLAARAALRPPGHRITGDGSGGRAIWVEAHWDQPRELAEKAGSVLGGPADLLVAWVHEEFRGPVLAQVTRLLAPGCPVVEVRGTTGAAAVPAELSDPRPALDQHPTQLVLIGSVSEHGGDRPLSHSEIAGGVLGAVRRAVDGRPPSLHRIGQTRPLVR